MDNFQKLASVGSRRGGVGRLHHDQQFMAQQLRFVAASA